MKGNTLREANEGAPDKSMRDARWGTASCDV